MILFGPEQVEREHSRGTESADRIFGIGAKQIIRRDAGIRLCLLEPMDDLPDSTKAMLQYLRDFALLQQHPALPQCKADQ
jgi:hypothetical protein